MDVELRKVETNESVELRRKAEVFLSRATQLLIGDPGTKPRTEILRLLHELQVYQIELEMQNEELRVSEAEVERGKALYFDLYDLAPIGFCRLDDKDAIVDANLALASLLGVSRQELPGHLLSDYIDRDSQDVFYLNSRRLRQDKAKQTYELVLSPRQGEPVWVLVQAAQGSDPEGLCLCRLGFVDITDRKKAEMELVKSVEEKEILLREVHHRVKNNLTVISSLLNLQAGKIHSPEEATAAFSKSRDRIVAMALVHEELYASKDYTRVDMREFIRKLTRQLQEIYCPEEGICLHAEVGEVSLDVNQSIPCGLILNELITNSFKYAFPARDRGNVTVGLRSAEGNQMELWVCDDGVGLPHALAELEKQSLGLVLVRLLVEQLMGRLEINGDQGACFRVFFPES